MTIDELVKIFATCSLQAKELQPRNVDARARCFVAFLVGALDSNKIDANLDAYLTQMKSSLCDVMPHLKK